jgi:hypothetical protein
MAFVWAPAASAREPIRAQCEQQTAPENRYSLHFDGHDDYVGADMRDNQHYFEGSMDEVGVWLTALEPEEVEAVAAGTAVTRDLAAFWRFELGTGE